MEKNKIFMVTSLYPLDNQAVLHNTNVCHYFAKEWVRMGYEVRVVFNYHVYPRIFYWLYKLLKPIVNRQTGKAIYDQYTEMQYDYELDGVKISRLPILKWRPGGKVAARDISKQVDKIEDIFQKEGFFPDFMVGHVLHPSIEILSELKKVYRVPTSITLHGIPTKISKVCLDKMDYVGFRSLAIQNAFENSYGNNRKSFMCYSGIPSSFIRKDSRKWGYGVHHIIYVGSLIRRKHPAALIPAANVAFQNENFRITYVGDGGERSKIDGLAKRYGITDKIVMKGQLNRDDIIKEYDSADVFVMISENEAFGLVYLEAMSRGCIVIASKNEGMDGIIKDGENGFLCKAGDEKELSKLLSSIRDTSPEELSRISDNARMTASGMTDYNMAAQYLEYITIC